MRLLTAFRTLGTVLLLAWGATAAADEVISSPGIGIRVTPGSPDETTAYYERISVKLGVGNTRHDLPDLTALLGYLGYSSLSAEDLEFKSPPDLMAIFPNDQLLVSRFFAPKIVDFNVKSVDPQYPYHAGWRKLVRILALPSSGADSAGLQAAYVLFNYVQVQLTDAPFPDGTSLNESVNTQVIIVPKTFTKGQEDSAYFLDFDTRTGGYKIHDFLSAAFDVAQDPSRPEETKRNYYVPTACAQCHGHDQEGGGPANKAFPYAKLNYLDTDQWYDMMAFGEFPSTLTTYDVLFDGGLDHTTAAYGAAFDVIKTLNNFIHEQNVQSVHPDDLDLFKIKAVEKWLALHQTSTDPVPSLDRALDLGSGSAVWQNTQDDRALLSLLDQYCFRCHSAVLFSVFDKQAVVDRGGPKGVIVKYVKRPKEDAFHMPQGRELDAQTIADIVKYVEALK